MAEEKKEAASQQQVAAPQEGNDKLPEPANMESPYDGEAQIDADDFTLQDFFTNPGGITPEEGDGYINPEGEKFNFDAVDTQRKQKAEDSLGGTQKEESGDVLDPVKLKEEYDRFKKEVEPALNLDKALRDDPKLFKHMMDYLLEESGQLPQTQQVPKQEEKKDVLPERPVAFDPYDAYNDPKSESYKWRESYERAEREQLARRVKEEATSEIRQLLNKEREQQARRLERVRQTEMLNSFKQSKNIPDSEFQEFIKWASTNQITLDSLYDVYATKKRMSSAEKEAVKSVKNQIQRNSYLPDTVAGIPSAPQRKQTDEDEFMRNLRASIGHADY